MRLEGLLALAWLFTSMGLTVGFAYLLGWLDDRAERRRPQNAAE